MKNEETKLTLDYYNQKAKNFSEETQHVDFSDMQLAFLKMLPKQGTILDFGCGAGRDSKAFKIAGYNIVAIDGSEELCKIAEEYIGHKVICTTFQEYTTNIKFDGIWCCASLLHLKNDELLPIISKLASYLNKNGCIYVSFKYGDFEGIRNGRYFKNMTEESLGNILKNIPSLKIIKTYITGDVREGRENEKWLNMFLQKI